MTDNRQTILPPSTTPRMNLVRMVKVWGLLAAAMTLAALACWAASGRMVRKPSRLKGEVLPDASAIQSLVWPDHLAPNRPWRHIVIHHTATPSATVEAIERNHLGRGFEGVGYHFVINNGLARGTADGRIVPTERWIEQRAGAHAKISHHPEFNREGIGICLVGNFEQKPPTAAQMASLEMLVLALADRYGIGLDRVVGHGELKNTKCPGRLFPLETLLMDLRKARLKRRLQAEPGL